MLNLYRRCVAGGLESRLPCCGTDGARGEAGDRLDRVVDKLLFHLNMHSEHGVALANVVLGQAKLLKAGSCHVLGYLSRVPIVSHPAPFGPDDGA